MTEFVKNISGSSELLKRQLVECLHQEKKDFMDIARTFYQQQGHRTREDYIELTESIIGAVDHVLNENNWDESLFLRNALKPLKKIREQACALLQEVNTANEEKKVTLRALGEDETLVYISLFQAEGNSLRKWELQLSSLESHLLGRPIYEKEEDVVKMIRQKLIDLSEAFIVVVIKKTDIQAFAHQAQRVDRYGKPLLTLKSLAVKPENIFEFVHQNKRYFFQKGKLLLQQL